VTYGIVEPGEYHHRDCKRWYRRHMGAEVFETRTELVITGDPGDDEDHNCDFMGCTTVSHVLFRTPLPNARGIKPEGRESAGPSAERAEPGPDRGAPRSNHG
jgi:hypothetical protein